MERLTEHHVDGKWAYMVCSGPCIDDDFDCNYCTKLADIIERLAAYEDTGLEPQEITAMNKAFMGYELAKITEFDGIPLQRLQELAQADKDGRLVISQLNNPLTLEDLREMDGEPVWCVDGSGNKRWAIVCVYGENSDDFDCYTTQYERIPGWCYGMDGRDGWLAYRRKPEGRTM